MSVSSPARDTSPPATRRFDTAPAPHLPPARSVRGVMGRVLLALLPLIVVQTVLHGAGVVLQLALAAGFGWLAEALALRARRRPSAHDASVWVTAVLFASCVPPLAPWWVAAVGMFAAIGVAKHAYGGIGNNLFNPAMVGVAVALLAFPLELSRWTYTDAVSWRVAFDAVVLGVAPAAGWDAVAQATPLAAMRDLATRGYTLGEIGTRLSFSANHAQAAAVLAGGVFLLRQRVIRWQVPAAVIATTLALALPFWLLDADRHPAPLQELASGGLMLAAFFIATDPVTGCTTPRGRLLFGAGVAAATFAIRRWGVTPDGVAFAVLLMNAAAPWMDRHTRPRYYGEVSRFDEARP